MWNTHAAVAFQVLSVGNIVGCAHKFPEAATSIKTGDGRNERWIVNSHIDLVKCNDVSLCLERIVVCKQIDEIQEEIIVASPIPLQTWHKLVWNAPFLTCCPSWPQYESVYLSF